MSLYDKIVAHQEKISIIGLGYVGLPIAVAFAKKAAVIGFDLNQDKISLYKQGVDPTYEVGNEELRRSAVEFTADEKKLKEARFHVVAVPTPINQDKTPDLSPVISASTILGRNLTKIRWWCMNPPFTRALRRIFVSPFSKRVRTRLRQGF